MIADSAPAEAEIPLGPPVISLVKPSEGGNLDPPGTRKLWVSRRGSKYLSEGCTAPPSFRWFCLRVGPGVDGRHSYRTCRMGCPTSGIESAAWGFELPATSERASRLLLDLERSKGDAGGPPRRLYASPTKMVVGPVDQPPSHHLCRGLTHIGSHRVRTLSA